MWQELVKPALLKLKTILQSDLLTNRIHYIALFVVCLFIIIERWYLVLILIPFFIFILRRDPLFIKKCLGIVALVLGIIFLNYQLSEHRESKLNINDRSFIGEVYRIEEDSLFLRIGKEKLLVKNIKGDFKPGDTISVYGFLKRPRDIKDEIAFNYCQYLKREGIFYLCYGQDYEVIKRGFNLNTLNFYLSCYFKNNFQDSEYFISLLLGDKKLLDEGLSDDLQRLGVSHLFAISGLHITIIVGMLGFILRMKWKNIIINMVLILMMVITGFSPSVMRASLLYICNYFVKKYDLPYGNLDILSFIFIMLLMINPYYFFNIGFELSFLVAFSFILSSEYLRGGYIGVTLKTSIIASLATLPIISNLSNQINLMTPIFNIVLIYFFTNIFLPSTIIFAFIPPIDFIYSYLVKLFSFMISTLNQFSIIFYIPNFSIISIIIFYCLFYYLMNKINLKRILIFSIFLLIINCQGILRPYGIINVFDVGQGDTSLISLPFNRGNMVIDCYNNGADYLIKKGIKKIDYLVITHGHEDHAGKAIEVMNKIKTKVLVISYFDDSSIINKIVIEAKRIGIKIYRLKMGDSFYLDRIKINVLGPLTYDKNLNNISLCLYFSIANKKYLFMGDMEDKEIEIIKYYNIECDVLKVAHHGSKTASSKAFIEAVKPKLCIISVGTDNKYGLPDYEALANLTGIIYQTNLMGSYEQRFVYF